MSSGLYEVLGIAKDAAPEQIRKAYKKKALETHPDRLPLGATPDQKAASEDKFRKVNNAYEVLIDAKKRNEYDIHGIWPIPEVDDIPTSHMPGAGFYRPSPHQRPTRNRPFPSPLFTHDPFASFFTDPFTLFNSIFEDMPRHSSGPRVHIHSQSHSPFRTRPYSNFDRMQADIEGFMESIDRDPFGMGHIPRFMPTRVSTVPALDISPMESGGGGQWVSDSFMSSTVNGVTQTIRKQKDSNGNEHITRTLPDGRKVRTINGVEQPPRGPPSPEDRYLQQPVATGSRIDYGGSNQYPGPPTSGYRESTYPFGTRERSRRHSDKYSYTSNPNSDERQHKKRWWQSGQ